VDFIQHQQPGGAALASPLDHGAVRGDVVVEVLRVRACHQALAQVGFADLTRACQKDKFFGQVSGNAFVGIASNLTVLTLIFKKSQTRY